ncbi:hypothetical protein V8C26DRAFT_383517 [Trichoderma gracile]
MLWRRAVFLWASLLILFFLLCHQRRPFNMCFLGSIVLIALVFWYATVQQLIQLDRVPRAILHRVLAQSALLVTMRGALGSGHIFTFFRGFPVLNSPDSCGNLKFAFPICPLKLNIYP